MLATPATPAGPATAHARFAAFYDHLYSAAGADREALLGAILGAKEALAQEALRRVLAAELGARGARFGG